MVSRYNIIAFTISNMFMVLHQCPHETYTVISASHSSQFYHLNPKVSYCFLLFEALALFLYITQMTENIFYLFFYNWLISLNIRTLGSIHVGTACCHHFYSYIVLHWEYRTHLKESHLSPVGHWVASISSLLYLILQ